jgi:hypothetical protein
MRAPGRTLCALAAGAAAAALAACGGGERQDADEPSGTFPVDVVRATFPAAQRLAQQSRLEIAVRNAGRRTVPNLAVTIQAGGTSGDTATSGNAEAFAEVSQKPGLANPSRPVWILDAGPRGGITAYTNTWALGALRPGRTKTFVWRVTAVKPGVHNVRYKVAAGLDNKARAVLAGGNTEPTGQFTIRISGKPADARVAEDGRVVKRPRD